MSKLANTTTPKHYIELGKGVGVGGGGGGGGG